ncbi:MAG: hypothetical protein KF855_16065 [Acidobacteria bacterium]|nr:hypothetical protein [Acidobacteriota bacterium]
MCRNKIFFSVLISLMLCLFSFGQTTAKRVKSEIEGYSFLQPNGWTSNQTAEGFSFVDQAQLIVIIVKSHNYRDHQAFWADANLEADGLELVGEQQNITGGKIFRTIKRTPQGVGYIDTAVVYRSDGRGGVAVVAITDQANSEKGFNTALAIANSMEFAAPKASAVAEQVRQALAGKQLTYLYTASGFSERKDIMLCRDGVFYQSTDMGGFSPGNSNDGSFAATGNKTGKWLIGADGKTLTLRFNNGAVSSFTVSARQASNEVGLDGQRYFVRSQSRC